jgi:hypothetical protein
VNRLFNADLLPSRFAFQACRNHHHFHDILLFSRDIYGAICCVSCDEGFNCHSACCRSGTLKNFDGKWNGNDSSDSHYKDDGSLAAGVAQYTASENSCDLFWYGNVVSFRAILGCAGSCG